MVDDLNNNSDQPNLDDDTSLEGIEGQSAAANTNAIQATVTGAAKKTGMRAFFGRFNIYLLLFILVVVVAGISVAVVYLRSQGKTNQPSGQNLPQSSLNQLSNSNVNVGDSKQTLNVQSNAVFAGQVLVRKDLQVAGKLQVGSSLSLTGITVSGSSQFDSMQVSKNLSVGGDSALQGQATIQKGITVGGGGTFGGTVSAPQLTTNGLQLNGDLTLTHHISAGGSTPSRTNGSALGSGGTVSVNGSDTAGSISVNTGSSPATGCLVSVNFATKFNATPHVIVTPIGSAAAAIGYYVTRTTTGFSVCAANAPGASQTFGFDYIIFG